MKEAASERSTVPDVRGDLARLVSVDAAHMRWRKGQRSKVLRREELKSMCSPQEQGSRGDKLFHVLSAIIKGPDVQWHGRFAKKGQGAGKKARRNVPEKAMFARVASGLVIFAS